MLHGLAANEGLTMRWKEAAQDTAEARAGSPERMPGVVALRRYAIDGADLANLPACVAALRLASSKGEGGRMAELEFTNQEQLKAWLEDKPAEWARAIAHRAAMRVLPLLADEWRTAAPIERKQGLTLAMFRANFISRVASTYSTHDMRAAARSAAAAARSSAAYSARSSANSAAASAAHSARSAAHSAAASAAADSAVWRSVSQDAQWLLECEDAPPAEQAKALLKVALWHEKMPDRIRQRFEELFRAVRADSENWNHWISWYSAAAAFDGGPTNDYFSQALELRIATRSKEWWDRGAEAVNADIAKWVEVEREQALHASLDAMADGWRHGGDFFEKEGYAKRSDLEAAKDAATGQLHEGLRRRAREFAASCNGVEDILNWGDSGFEDAVKRFLCAVDVETEVLASSVATLYDTAVDLGSFLDFDAEIRAKRRGNENPLDATRRRAFESLIRAAAPFVRRFPTARELDDQAGAFLLRDDLFAPARRIAQAAGDFKAIRPEDRDLLLSLLDALKREGQLSHKAKTRGFLSARGLAAVVLSFYVGMAGNQAAEHSVLANKAADLVVAAEQDVLAVLEALAPDQRNALLSGLEELKARRPDPPEEENEE